MSCFFRIILVVLLASTFSGVCLRFGFGLLQKVVGIIFQSFNSQKQYLEVVFQLT